MKNNSKKISVFVYNEDVTVKISTDELGEKEILEYSTPRSNFHLHEKNINDNENLGEVIVDEDSSGIPIYRFDAKLFNGS